MCVSCRVSATDWSLVQRSPTDCGASLCVIKIPRTRGGYSPAKGLQNTNPQWVVAPVEENILTHYARVQTCLSTLILNRPSFRIITLISKLSGWYSVIHCLWNRERSITPSGYCSPCKPLHLTGPVQSGMLVLHRPLTLILPLPVRMGVVHKRV